MCQPTRDTPSLLSDEQRRIERARYLCALRHRGLAITSKRTAIYETFLEVNDHLCAEHILQKLTERHPLWRLNKTTVYRALALFVSLGLISEMKQADGRAQYELALGGPHGHLLCQRCGRLHDLDAETPRAFQDAIPTQLGFELALAGHALPGLCQRCRG